MECGKGVEPCPDAAPVLWPESSPAGCWGIAESLSMTSCHDNVSILHTLVTFWDMVLRGLMKSRTWKIKKV